MPLPSEEIKPCLDYQRITEAEEEAAQAELERRSRAYDAVMAAIYAMADEWHYGRLRKILEEMK